MSLHSRISESERQAQESKRLRWELETCKERLQVALDAANRREAKLREALQSVDQFTDLADLTVLPSVDSKMENAYYIGIRRGLTIAHNHIKAALQPDAGKEQA